MKFAEIDSKFDEAFKDSIDAENRSIKARTTIEMRGSCKKMCSIPFFI